MGREIMVHLDRGCYLQIFVILNLFMCTKNFQLKKHSYVVFLTLICKYSFGQWGV